MKRFLTLLLMAALWMPLLRADHAAPKVTYGHHSAHLCPGLKANPLQTMKNELAAFAPAPAAAEETEQIDIAGSYVYGTYSMIFFSNEPEAEFIDNWTIEPMQIIANPAVENGYIIRNFMSEFWNGGLEEDEKFAMNDINATWNPETKQLTIAPYQVLFHHSSTDNATGQPVEIDMHIIGVVGDSFSKEGTVVLEYQHGLFSLAEGCYGFTFGEIRSDYSYEVYGPGYQFGAINAYIPNGTYRVHTDALSDGQMEFPILGVWKETPIRNAATGEVIDYTKFHVVNFSGFDMLRVVPLVRCPEADRVLISGDYGYTGWQLCYNPSANPNLNFNQKLYAAETDSRGYPVGEGYELYGTVEKCTPEQVRITFPTYGLFDSSDVLWGDALWEDGELFFEPRKIKDLEYLSMDRTDIVAYMGADVKIEVKGYPSLEAIGQLIWTSSNPAVAIVNNGVVTPIAPGRATVTVTSASGVTTSCNVTVANTRLEGFSVLSSQRIIPGKNKLTYLGPTDSKFTLSVDPANEGAKISPNALRITSSDPNMVRFGRATALDDSETVNVTVEVLKYGVCQINLTDESQNVTQSFSFQAKMPVYPTEIYLVADKNLDYITVGETVKFTVKVTPDNADYTLVDINGQTLSGSLSSEIEFKQTGEQYISASLCCGDTRFYSSKSFDVYYPLKSSELCWNNKPVSEDNKAVEMLIGETSPISFDYTLFDPYDPAADIYKSYYYSTQLSVSDNDVIYYRNTYDADKPEQGVIAALKPGTATVTVTLRPGWQWQEENPVVVEKTMQITVVGESYIPMETLAIMFGSVELGNDSAIELPVGETAALKAVVRPENATSKEVEWSSSNPEMATVDRDGLVFALTEGSTEITLSDPLERVPSARCTINVTGSSRILSVSMDNTPDAEIYTMGGIKLPAGTVPAPGAYIVRSGDKVAKLIVR